MWKKIDRLENCAGLVVPKINKELWLTPTMRKTTKEIDISFQIAQKYLSQGLIPLVTLMDKLLDTDRNEDFQLAQSAFQLCAYAHRGISNFRRQQLRKVVADKYKQLCNDLSRFQNKKSLEFLQQRIHMKHQGLFSLKKKMKKKKKKKKKMSSASNFAWRFKG